MKKTGIVESVVGKTAKVRIRLETSCGGDCGSCAGCDVKAVTMEAVNNIGADAGDTVELEMESKKVLKAAFFVYFIPLIIFALGYFAGEKLSGNEGGGIITGFVLMCAAFAVLIIYNRKQKTGAEYSLMINKVIR